MLAAGSLIQLKQRIAEEIAVKRGLQFTGNELEAASDAMLMIDRAWAITAANAAVARLLGLEALAPGAQFWQVCPAAVGSPLELPLREAMQDRRPRTFFASWPNPGVRCFFRVSNLSDGLLLTCGEDTEVVEADPAPYLQESAFRQLADAMPVLMSYVDATQRYQFNNATYERWFGVSREEIRGKHLREVLGEAAYEKIRPHADAALQGQLVRFESVLPYREGGARAVQVTYLPHRDRTQRVVGFYVLVQDLSEWREAQLALLASEERLRRAVQHAPVPVMIHADDGEVIHLSDTWCELTGYSRDELKTVTDWLRRAYGRLEPVRSALARLYEMTEGSVEEGEFLIRTKSGAPRVWEFSSSALGRLADGRRTVVSIAVDITATKAATAALREGERLLKMAQQASRSGIWRLDTTSGDGWWSEECHELYGTDAPTFNPTLANWSNCLLAEDRAAALAAVRQAIASGQELRLEYRVNHPTRGIRWLWSYGERRSADGVDMVGATIDITARKEAERALRLSEEKFAIAFRDSPDALVLTRASDGRIREANRAFERLFGWTREELLGRSGIELGFYEHPEQREALMAALREHGRLQDHDLSVRIRSGERRTILFSCAPFEADGEPLLLTQLRDVTEQKRVLAELAAARDAAVAASRAKDDFIAMLSHELRTPLNPVLLEATDAAHDPALGEAVRDRFARIAEHVQLEARLIDDLLDLNRLNVGKTAFDLRPLDLHPLVKEAVANLEEELTAKQLRVNLALAASGSWVEADEVRVRQVLWNVLKNAIKFTPKGGAIRVRSANRAEGQLIELAVEDTGIGMREADLELVFEPFVQAPAAAGRAHGGLGLGLAITRSIVLRLGGEIIAQSDGLDQGTTIIMRLPTVSRPTGAANARVLRSPLAAKYLGKAVLLAEDHISTRQTLTTLLTRRGLNVHGVGSCVEALAWTGAVDLLISDLGLPDGDGCDLLLNLRQRQPTLPAIALSGYGMDADRARTREAGFADHLVKPITVDALERAIESAWGVSA
jgi:PAS domain S-box-containing protein